MSEELLSSQRSLIPRPLEVVDELVQGGRPTDVHAIPHTDVAWRSRRHHDGMHLAVGAVPVIAAKVSRVRCRLVKVGLVWFCFALQLQHHHGAIDQKDDVGSPRFEWQLVLEDGRVLLGKLVDLNDLADFDLDLWDRLIPGVHLKSAGASEELLERDADDLRLLPGEGWEVTLPPVPRSP
jgi:hypothetical protein